MDSHEPRSHHDQVWRERVRHRPWVLLLGVLLVLLAACSAGPGNDQEPPGSAEPLTIVISDFSYLVPESVPPGTTVTVRNEDNVGHTVTSDEEGVFDVAVGPGEEATFTVPDEAGEFPFHCTPHPQMTAALVVG